MSDDNIHYAHACARQQMMTTTVLLVFLLAALSIALHDRCIYWSSGTWWAVQSIAIAMFVTGRVL